MRRKDESKKPIIADFINAFFAHTQMSICICYDFVGFIPLDEPMKQETA